MSIMTPSGVEVLLAPPTLAQTTSALIDVASAGDNTLVAATAGQTIRIHKLFFVCDAAVNIYFRNGTAGAALTGTMKFGAGGSMVLDFDTDPWFVTSAGNAFVVNLSGAYGIRGKLHYTKS